MRSILLLAFLGFAVNAFSVQKSGSYSSAIEGTTTIDDAATSSNSMQRRDAFKMVGLALLSEGILTSVVPPPAWASGGATAGKYT